MWSSWETHLACNKYLLMSCDMMTHIYTNARLHDARVNVNLICIFFYYYYFSSYSLFFQSNIFSFNKNYIYIFFLLQRFECRNHIRVIQTMENGNRLYVCGTNAHNPKDYVIYVSIAESRTIWFFFSLECVPSVLSFALWIFIMYQSPPIHPHPQRILPSSLTWLSRNFICHRCLSSVKDVRRGCNNNNCTRTVLLLSCHTSYARLHLRTKRREWKLARVNECKNECGWRAHRRIKKKRVKKKMRGKYYYSGCDACNFLW